MRILLDECIPQNLKGYPAPHDCRTVADERWAGAKNGELLSPAAKAGFQAFLTIDRGIEYQQNLATRTLAVILIRTKSNRLADLLSHVPEIVQTLESLQPGELAKVGLGAQL